MQLLVFSSVNPRALSKLRTAPTLNRKIAVQQLPLLSRREDLTNVILRYTFIYVATPVASLQGHGRTLSSRYRNTIRLNALQSETATLHLTSRRFVVVLAINSAVSSLYLDSMFQRRLEAQGKR